MCFQGDFLPFEAATCFTFFHHIKNVLANKQTKSLLDKCNLT